MHTPRTNNERDRDRHRGLVGDVDDRNAAGNAVLGAHDVAATDAHRGLDDRGVSDQALAHDGTSAREMPGVARLHPPVDAPCLSTGRKRDRRAMSAIASAPGSVHSQ